jgi:hypothetical protein
LNQENAQFKAKVKEKGGNKSEIGRKLGGVSGQLIGQYIAGRQKPKEDFFIKWEKYYHENIRNMFETNVSREIAPDAKDDRLTALIQSNKDLAESNKALARSHERLVEMMATAGVPVKNVEADAAMFRVVFALLKQVGKDVWKSEADFQQALSKAASGNAPGKKQVGNREKVGS